MRKATFIHVTGETLEVEPRNKKDFTLSELQDFVSGYIQMLDLGDRYMFVNEEGKLMGCPVNEKATEMLTGTAYEGDTIVGDVLVCGKEMVE